ncbi:ankyrin repeat-containing domain protein [Aspergillus ambiguus]|uniref:ankyrin repeat-containing domain protein n=1 Tax=Aspergillus ambiguus TaxID=176160 RepID=UPI003CCDE193
MVADFQSLPSELILDLGEMLPDGALNSLILTNRRFAELLNPILWKISSDEDEGSMLNLPLTRTNSVLDLLKYAVATDNSLMARKIVQLSDFDYETYGEAIIDALHETVVQGNQYWLELILNKLEDQGETLDTPTLSSLVYQAVELQNGVIVDCLVRHGQIDFACWNNSCQHLIRANNDRLLNIFLDNAQLNRAPVARDFNGSLMMAILSGHIPALEALQKRGADMNSNLIVDRQACPAPLRLAIQRSGHGVVTWLLDHGADVNAIDSRGRTAAHEAARDAELLRLLVSYGADVHLKDEDGNPPLAIAAYSNALDAFNYLLSFLDDCLFQPEDIEWCLNALTYTKCPGIIFSLLDRIDLTRYGEDLLFRTEKSSNILLLRELAGRGVSLDARRSDGMTILHRYALRPVYGWPRYWGDIEKVRVAATSFVLESHPEGLHYVDKCGDTPLHMAARTSFRLMVQTLLERGASSEALNSQGISPIDFGRRTLEHSEHLSGLYNGIPPRDFGGLNNCRELYELLKSYGAPEQDKFASKP